MASASFKPEYGFSQFGEGRMRDAELHLQAISRYNLRNKKRKGAEGEDIFSTPNKVKKGAAEEKHPTDLPPNKLDRKNVFNKHIGCFLREVTLKDLPRHQLNSGVLPALHHICASLPIALSKVFPNHSTETQRKLFLHAFHAALLEMSKGNLKMTQEDYLDPPEEDAGVGASTTSGSPESAASVRALTEDSDDQAGHRASDLCFQTRCTKLDEFLASYLVEEKGGNKTLSGSVGQWIGYAAPKLVQLLQALSQGVRWLDLPGCVTSSKEWLGLLARPLAWLHFAPEGPKLVALAEGEGERLKEAGKYLEGIKDRLAKLKEEFPRVTYQGPFLVFEVLECREARALFTFPLEELSPNSGSFDYIAYFVSSTFRGRVKEWTAEFLYELYGAAWASQHLRSAVLTYAKLEDARYWSDKELTSEAVRTLLPESILPGLLLDPLSCYRAPPPPVTDATIAGPSRATASEATHPGTSNGCSWWEEATIKGFARGMDSAGWRDAIGTDATSQLQRTASKYIVDVVIRDELPHELSPKNQFALEVLGAAKQLLTHNKNNEAKEVLRKLVDMI